MPMTHMQYSIFSCQTILTKAEFLEFGNKNANLATLLSTHVVWDYCVGAISTRQGLFRNNAMQRYQDNSHLDICHPDNSHLG